MNTKQFLSSARFRGRVTRLAKSANAAGRAQTLTVTNNPRSASQASTPKNNPLALPLPPATVRPPYTAAGGFVRVQRPNLHAQPVLAQLLSVGRHGIQVADGEGRVIKVRHDHVVDGHAAPDGKERAEHLMSLQRRGAPVDASERFMQHDAAGQVSRRPTEAQLGLLTEMARHGVPVDLAAVAESGTHKDVQGLLRRYVTDPDGLVT